MRVADSRLTRRVGQPFARLQRLFHGARPLTVKQQNLRAVHEALPSVGHEVGMSGAPPAQRAGPLLRPANVEAEVTRFDDGAVDDAGGNRRDFAGLDRDHDLVEQRKAISRLSEVNHRHAEAKPREGCEIRVVEAFGDCGRLGEQRLGTIHSTAVQVLQCGRHEEEPLLYAVRVLDKT